MSEAAEERLYGIAIARGVVRLLAEHDRPSITEVRLKNGRRADVMALAKDGEIWIVEVKSSVADYRSDSKWQDYLITATATSSRSRRISPGADPKGMRIDRGRRLRWRIPAPTGAVETHSRTAQGGDPAIRAHGRQPPSDHSVRLRSI